MSSLLRAAQVYVDKLASLEPATPMEIESSDKLVLTAGAGKDIEYVAQTHRFEGAMQSQVHDSGSWSGAPYVSVGATTMFTPPVELYELTRSTSGTTTQTNVSVPNPCPFGRTVIGKFLIESYCSGDASSGGQARLSIGGQRYTLLTSDQNTGVQRHSDVSYFEVLVVDGNLTVTATVTWSGSGSASRVTLYQVGWSEV